MLSWLVVVIIIALIFVFIKTRYMKHKIVWVIVILIAGLLYAGYFFSVSKANVDLNSPQGVETAVRLYLSWFVSAFHNTKILTGQAISQDWSGNVSDQTPNGKNATDEKLQKKFYK